MPSSSLHVVVPAGIDDPRRPSGGNVYDRRLCDGLVTLGWAVQLHQVEGGWPSPASADRRAVADLLSGLPSRVRVLVDGLVGSTVPDELAAHRDRLRLAALVHLPLEDADERRALTCATTVLTTSRWTRERLLSTGVLDPWRIQVAEPGVDPAERAVPTADGGRLLCVGAVTWAKGHDVLIDALAQLADESWQLTCVGSLDRDHEFVMSLRARVLRLGLGGRVAFTGPLQTDGLSAVYAASDLVVLASRRESFGMVVTEGLARGLPALVSDVGGLPSALGRLPDGRLPGELVPGEDVAAWTQALRRWLRDDEHRRLARAAAARRRTLLPDWSTTAERVAEALEGAA